MRSIPNRPALASRSIRLCGLLYESLLFIGIAFFGGALLTTVWALLSHPHLHAPAGLFTTLGGWWRLLFQVILIILFGCYYTYCWRTSGQTIPMKAWRMRLLQISQDGEYHVVSRHTAWQRYTYSVLFFPINFFWCFIDTEGLFLHDRLANTRLIRIHPKNKAKKKNNYHISTAKNAVLHSSYL